MQLLKNLNRRSFLALVGSSPLLAVDLPKPEPKQWALIYGTTPYKQAIETEKVINGIGEGFVAFHSFPPESMHQTVKLYFVAPLWQKDHVRNSMIKDGYVFEAV